MCPTCIVAAASAFGLSSWLSIQPSVQAAFLGFTVATASVWLEAMLRRDGKALVRGQKMIFGLVALSIIPYLISLFDL